MFKYIASLFRLLLPILKTSVIQVAADTLADMAYPNTRRRFTSYNRMAPRTSYSQRPRGYTDTVDHSARVDDFLSRPTTSERFHDVLMVALDISGPNPALVKATLQALMPECGTTDDNGVNIDSWWIADDNQGTSDCDSAVFVSKGKQEEARALLREHGLV